MIKEWFTPNELESLSLSHLPATRIAIANKAKKENWKNRPRKGRGGGKEYHLSNFCKEARIEIMEKVGAELAKDIKLTPENKNKHRIQRLHNLSDESKNKALARATLVEAAESFAQDGFLIKRVGFEVFSKEYNENRINVEPWIREAIKKVSRPSLERWAKKKKEDGIAVLAENRGRKSGGCVIEQDKEVVDFILGLIYEKPHLSSEVILLAIAGEFGEARKPAKRTLQRFIKNWKEKNAELLLSIQNPDAWRSKYMSAVGNASAKAQYLNHVWEFDSTPTDIMLADGKRHTIIGVIDVWSRRVKFLVSHSSNSAAVAALTRKAITDWGYPKIAKTDNGSDYVSNHIRDAFIALEIRQELCIPFNPQEKPHIERVFRTFSHNLLEGLTGFVGHNISEREALENRKGFAARLMKKGQDDDTGAINDLAHFTPEELQEFCDSWVENYYHNKEHNALGCSPNEKVLSSQVQPKMIEDESELFILLNSQSRVSSVQKSSIRWQNKHYSAACLAIYSGQKVKVRLDDSEPGAIYVFTLNNEYIGRAIDPEYYGMNLKTHALEIKKAQSQYLAQERKELREKAANVNAHKAMLKALEHQADKNGKIIHMPKKGEVHKPKAVIEAEKAKGIIKTPETTKDKEEFAAYVAEKSAKKVVELPKQVDPFEVFMRAINLQKQIEKGLPIQPADAEFLNRYTASAQYQAALITYKRGGEKAVRRVIS